MNFRHAFRNVIAPELNHFYTVAPRFDRRADCGWSCREHALHVKVLAALLGASADIRRGEFVLEWDDLHIESGLTGDGHAWCRVKTALPADLSMTFKFFGFLGLMPRLHAPVWGIGRNGDCSIVYRRWDQTLVEKQNDGPYITFTEHSILDHSPEALTRNPYLLLYAPDQTDPLNWDVVYGTDIYARITWHCLLVATGRAKPMAGRGTATQAVRWIADTYPNAVEDICSNLAR